MQTRLEIIKSRRALRLVTPDGVTEMRVALGAHSAGHKTREGDGRTPEGEYAICTRNPRSKYTLSLGLDYPRAADARAAFARGEIDAATREAVENACAAGVRPPWDTPLGGFIMIHGGGTDGDWTAGCVAVSDADIAVLWERCPIGTPVRIMP